ncbi:MAG: radical SAM protein, partial [Anaerolineae bacterium]|nr:radical SAM protein [Anaerolineae bacterium]
MILSDNDDKAHLVIIQPTPFCNIACRYCYLPTQERLMTKRMDEAVLTKIFEALYAENLMSDETEIVWHAGEPLTVPISFYENAMAIINRVRGDKPAPRHVIQTNATLINDQWCRFIKAHDVIIGVSLDGTQHIHDRNRLDRYARGTFDKTMRGIRLLQAHDIPVHIISVVTDYALDYAQEMFDFFVAHNLFKLAFNIEEITGAYDQSSLLDKESRWKIFLQTMFDCQAQSDKPIVIREFKNMSRALMLADAQRNHSVTTPFGFINFDVFGNFSTFCFELMA